MGQETQEKRDDQDISIVLPNKDGHREEDTNINSSAAARVDDPRRRASSHGGKSNTNFTFAALEAATENFKSENLLGEGSFGQVYRGYSEDTNQAMAVKKLNPNGCQGLKEYFAEVNALTSVDHPNLIELIGQCYRGSESLLVYELMPLGSLEDHLHGHSSNSKPLDWNTRMKIAAGVARGLEYLHHTLKPPIIHRDLKSSNILLGEGYHAKLSDFGLARKGPQGEQNHVNTRVMGTDGYTAPEYESTGRLTVKSDIYSFGVLLLEIISGRKAMDHEKSPGEKNLVEWAKPLFEDPEKLVDPLLQDQYQVSSLRRVVAIGALCLQDKDNATLRPSISEVAAALDKEVSKVDHDPSSHVPCPTTPTKAPKRRASYYCT